MRTNTETLVSAMRILARDVQSDDLVANSAIAEASDRLAEQQGQIKVMADLLSDCIHLINNALNEDYETQAEYDYLDELKLKCVNAIANADTENWPDDESRIDQIGREGNED